MSNFVQIAIIAFIVASIIWHVWRGGAANPESTGALGRRLSAISGKVGSFEGRLGHVEEKVDRIEREGATTVDIEKLEKVIDEKFRTIRAEAAGHQALSQATNRNVQRIYDIMLEKGLSGK